MASQARNRVNMSPGHRPMVSLDSPLACSTAGALRTPQSKSKAQGAKSQSSSLLRLGTWNVQSLLESGGPVETARQRSDIREAEDRCIDLVIRELKRYNIKIAAIQETKWFGSSVYQVGESIVLAAGRPTPGPTEVKHRGEGVGIVLMGSAVNSWKAGGEQWKAWSSRLVTAKLVVQFKKRRRPTHLHILSCYAPTFAASREEKDRFWDDLQLALDSIPSSEPYIMLGDFNARVGSRVSQDDQWVQERDTHGYGDMNQAGKELLAFLAINEATVCNTWFRKKNIKKRTWQHPKSKKWYCLDYAIMRQRDKRKCMDVSVMRGAECHMDHTLLRIKLKTKQVNFHTNTTHRTGRKYDVSKLSDSSTDTGQGAPRDKFPSKAGLLLKHQWPADGG